MRFAELDGAEPFNTAQLVVGIQVFRRKIPAYRLHLVLAAFLCDIGFQTVNLVLKHFTGPG